MILDSGAVIGWSRGDVRVRALLREAISRNVELRVPGGRNTADALVAAEALAVSGSLLLTSDPDDLEPLLVDSPAVTIMAV